MIPFEGVREVQSESFPTKEPDRKSGALSSELRLSCPGEYPRRKQSLHRRSSALSASPHHTTVPAHWSWQNKHSPKKVPPGSGPALAKQITPDRPKQVDSKLTMISQALAARKHCRWSSVEPGALPVSTYSTALACRAYKPKNESEQLTSQFDTYDDFSEKANMPVHPEESLRVGYQVHHGPSSKSRRLHLEHVQTRATITLRRASGMTAFKEPTTAAQAASCRAEILHLSHGQGMGRSAK